MKLYVKYVRNKQKTELNLLKLAQSERIMWERRKKEIIDMTSIRYGRHKVGLSKKHLHLLSTFSNMCYIKDLQKFQLAKMSCVVSI